MERKKYVVQNYDAGVEKLVKLTEEQANAIEWFIDFFDIAQYGYDITPIDEND